MKRNTFSKAPCGPLIAKHFFILTDFVSLTVLEIPMQCILILVSTVSTVIGASIMQSG